MRKALLAVALLGCTLSAKAQTPAPAAQVVGAQTFSFVASGITLPGNRPTLSGAVAGMTMNVTTNFQLRDENILSTGAPGVNFYGGGFNYFLPVIGKTINNVSPNINGLRLHAYITGTFGRDQVQSGATHYAFLSGMGVYYDLTGSGIWTFGTEIRYAKLPGYANNTVVVSVGPAIHF